MSKGMLGVIAFAIAGALFLCVGVAGWLLLREPTPKAKGRQAAAVERRVDDGEPFVGKKTAIFDARVVGSGFGPEALDEVLGKKVDKVSGGLMLKWRGWDVTALFDDLGDIEALPPDVVSLGIEGTAVVVEPSGRTLVLEHCRVVGKPRTRR